MKIILTISFFLISKCFLAQQFIPLDLNISNFISPEIIKKNRISKLKIDEYFGVENIDTLKIPRVEMTIFFNQKGIPFSEEIIEQKDTIFIKDNTECALEGYRPNIKMIQCDSFGRIINFETNSLYSIHKIYDKSERILSSTKSFGDGEGGLIITQSEYYYSNKLDSIIVYKGKLNVDFNINSTDTIYTKNETYSFIWKRKKISQIIVNGLDYRQEKYSYFMTFRYKKDLLNLIELREGDNFLSYRCIISKGN